MGSGVSKVSHKTHKLSQTTAETTPPLTQVITLIPQGLYKCNKEQGAAHQHWELILTFRYRTQLCLILQGMTVKEYYMFYFAMVLKRKILVTELMRWIMFPMNYRCWKVKMWWFTSLSIIKGMIAIKLDYLYTRLSTQITQCWYKLILH